jgi:cell division protein FtsI/penicillin-binding protein 2
MFMSSGAGPKPKASIEGGALDSAAVAQAQIPATPAAPAQAAPAPSKQKADFTEPAPPAPVDDKPSLAQITQRTVRDVLVDLRIDKLRLEGDHYVAPLADGRLAKLTLDPALQKLAEKLLDESRAPRGAIVAMTPDGKILAFAGRRTELPKGGKQGIPDPSLVTSVWAPAASIFKLVTASSLVANGYDVAAKVCYHGGVRSVMESNLSDSKHDGPCETLAYGVAHSNNAILGKLAYQNLDPTKLDRTARDLGWVSTIPSSFGLKASCGELELPKNKDLEFAKSAAGFLGSRLSVLGGALLGATFAHGGEQPAPYLIAEIDGKPVPAPKGHRVITKDVAEKVASMMVETCASGSAARTFRRNKKVTVAGKTGTLSVNKPFYMEHSWFVGFAPAESPEVVVSVLLGNPESWWLRGHEAAKRMIDRAMRRAEDRDGKGSSGSGRAAAAAK